MIRLLILIAIVLAASFFLFSANVERLLMERNSSIDPDIRLEIDSSNVNVKNGNISEELITITITRLDGGSEPRTYNLLFAGDLKSIYPVGTNGKRISEVTIGPLIGKNAKEIVQFRIYGEKGEFETVKGRLPISLWRAGNPVSKESFISVTVN